MSKPLKVGFDLDGVILNNPLRNFRIFAKKLKFLKPLLFKQKKSPFYIPKTEIEKSLLKLIHKTSYRIDPSIKEITRFAREKKIEAYIVSGRYDFLKDDFDKWIEKLNQRKIFKSCYSNIENLQPNEFKVRMIKKLKLDIYVEDNFDIIEKLNHHTKTKILWLSNLIDRNIPYRLKFFSLKEVCQYLRTLV